MERVGYREVSQRIRTYIVVEYMFRMLGCLLYKPEINEAFV